MLPLRQRKAGWRIKDALKSDLAAFIAHAVFKDDLGLAKITAQGCVRTKQDQRGIGDPPVHDQLRVRKQPVERPRRDVRVGRFSLPEPPQDFNCSRIEIF